MCYCMYMCTWVQTADLLFKNYMQVIHDIAGTTEKIFQMKHNLYDVFVDSCSLHTHSQYVEPLLRVTRADRERFEHLVNLR